MADLAFYNLVFLVPCGQEVKALSNPTLENVDVDLPEIPSPLKELKTNLTSKVSKLISYHRAQMPDLSRLHPVHLLQFGGSITGIIALILSVSVIVFIGVLVFRRWLLKKRLEKQEEIEPTNGVLLKEMSHTHSKEVPAETDAEKGINV